MVSKKKKFPITEKKFLDTYGGNLKKFKRDITGLVSYFNREADITVQPRKDFGPIPDKDKDKIQYGVVNVGLGEHQKKALYQGLKKAKGHSERERKLMSSLGRVWSSFSGLGYKSGVRTNCNVLEQHLDEYGRKIQVILDKIQSTNKEKHWVYCGLQNRGGMTPIGDSLSCLKWQQVRSEKNERDLPSVQQVLKHCNDGNIEEACDELGGQDYNRYVKLESKTPQKLSATILQVLNHKANVDGRLIRVVLGDRSRKEGMDLYSIKHVHIVSPELKYSDWHQAISRAIRYCAFKFVPSVENWKVRVYTYVASGESIKGQSINVDSRILDIATTSAKKLNPYMDAVKQAAVDCTLNKGMHKLEHIKCMKTKFHDRANYSSKTMNKNTASGHRYGYNDGFKDGYDEGVENGSKKGQKDKENGKSPKTPKSASRKPFKMNSSMKKKPRAEQEYAQAYHEGYQNGYEAGNRQGYDKQFRNSHPKSKTETPYSNSSKRPKKTPPPKKPKKPKSPKPPPKPSPKPSPKPPPKPSPKPSPKQSPKTQSPNASKMSNKTLRAREVIKRIEPFLKKNYRTLRYDELFTILGITNMDKTKVKRQYIKASLLVHPNKLPTVYKKGKEPERYFKYVNHAYKTLKN